MGRCTLLLFVVHWICKYVVIISTPVMLVCFPTLFRAYNVSSNAHTRSPRKTTFNPYFWHIGLQMSSGVKFNSRHQLYALPCGLYYLKTQHNQKTYFSCVLYDIFNGEKVWEWSTGGVRRTSSVVHSLGPEGF